MKNSFLEKKKTPCKRKWIHYEHPEISHYLMDRAMKQSTHQFHKTFFLISKCLACNAEKALQLRITKKEWIKLTLWTYIQTCMPVLYVMKMAQNKSDLKLKMNKSSAWTYCWQKLLCSISYFRISIFDPLSQRVQMEGSYHLLSNRD